jgi:hypothetical protein
MSQLNGFDFQSEGEDQFLNELISSALISADAALVGVQETADWYREQVAILEDWMVEHGYDD